MIEFTQTVSLIFIGAGALSSVCYILSGAGSIIAIRVHGQRQIIKLTQARPIASFFTLAVIPPSLIFVKKVCQWEAPLMKCIAYFTEKTEEEYTCTMKRIDRTLAPSFNSSKPRLIFGALSLPFFGSYIGEKVLTSSWWGENRFLRCVAGSAIFLGCKGVCKTMYLYMQNEVHKNSRISNYKKRTANKQTRTVGRFQLPSF